MTNILRIARKEMAGYFGQPTGYIFIAVFLAATLFAFFWVDTFFARNIADVRPLFHWIPILLVFLVASLTMRMWSEERRAGTLETLLTAPVPAVCYVLGKFLAGLGLLAVALVLTLPLPVTTSLLGPLDWGPVFAGYAAVLFLAAAYIAIGLFVSARTDNQIVSLILTVLICGIFYLLGSDILRSLFGNRLGEILALLGSGSRFDSIQRGVVDLRDLYYYLSIAGVFLTLNVYSLERLRWSVHARRSRHNAWRLLTGLAVANFLAGNLWLQQLPAVRTDVTQGQVYTISPATRQYLGQLREPLLVRGYFSAKTHPLLAPLVPQLEDLLKEYAAAGGSRLRVEIVDPQQDPAAEKEANSRYGIHPVPFQSSNKYQASVVNSYFNILIAYGDQYETLSFRDLIEVKTQTDKSLSVTLRDPEYEITRAIKKVLYSYQGGGDIFAGLQHPLTFNAYVSPTAALPQALAKLRDQIGPVLDEIKAKSGGKLSAVVQDPEADGGKLAKILADKYGFTPLAASPLDPKSFWFYMTLAGDGRVVDLPIPDSMDREGLKRVILSGIKQFSRGYMHTVALYTPPVNQRMGMPDGKSFEMLESKLRQTVVLKHTDLKDGRVPDDADLLLLLSPEAMDDRQLYAIDQFLMKGGTVLAAASPIDVTVGESLSARKNASGLFDWFRHNGLTVMDRLVLDPHAGQIPIPVERDVGGYRLREIQMLNYPYFIDLRHDGMPNRDSPTEGISQLTLPWPSPITIDANKGRKVIPLLQSSPQSWSADSLAIIPDFTKNPDYGFPVMDDKGSKLLAVAVEGSFSSYFKDRPSPLVAKPEAVQSSGKAAGTPPKEPTARFTGKIDHSPDSARIILIGSNSVLTDDALDMVSTGAGMRVLAPVQLIENAIDWSLEDRGLLSIRSRGNFSRLLMPLSRQAQLGWEYLNYGLALFGLLVLWAVHRLRQQSVRRHYRAVLTEGRA